MAIDPLKGVDLPQPWRGWFERLRAATNNAATKVSGMPEDNVFVAGANGDLKDSGSTLPSGSSGTLVTSDYVADYVGERYDTEAELPEAGTEEGARHGSYRIGLLIEDDYAYFDENGKLILYGVAGVQLIVSINHTGTPAMFAVFDADGNLQYRTAEQLSDDLSGHLATRDYVSETFITENLLEEAGLQPTHSITDILSHVSDATPEQMLKADANGLPVNASNTDAQVTAAVNASHARSHALDGTSDHSIGGLTNAYLVKSDGTKVVPATNTDAQVAAAVSLSLTIEETIHQWVAERFITDSPLPEAEVLANPFVYSEVVTDDGFFLLPEITNCAFGTVTIGNAGVIEASAEFEIDSTGTVNLIRAVDAKIAVNVAAPGTDGKFNIGIGATNPVICKNRLGGPRRPLFRFWYN